MISAEPGFDGVKITDFGIAKMAEQELAEAAEGGEESMSNSSTALGALPYMAPEMIESSRTAGKLVIQTSSNGPWRFYGEEKRNIAVFIPQVIQKMAKINLEMVGFSSTLLIAPSDADRIGPPAKCK